MRTIILNVYTIDDHPNKDKVYSWIKNNWFDLADYVVSDYVDSINALAELMMAKATYSISQYQCSSNYFAFSNIDYDFVKSLKKESYPLTGVHTDEDVIEAVLNLNHKEIFKKIEEQLCQANNYEFFETGALCGSKELPF
jgi:hypothetical protein